MGRHETLCRISFCRMEGISRLGRGGEAGPLGGEAGAAAEPANAMEVIADDPMMNPMMSEEEEEIDEEEEAAGPQLRSFIEEPGFSPFHRSLSAVSTNTTPAVDMDDDMDDDVVSVRMTVDETRAYLQAAHQEVDTDDMFAFA